MLKNVTLMKSPYSSDDFFPRVNMYKTSSFGELPENERQALYKLYVEYVPKIDFQNVMFKKKKKD
jgi:hypothetical protein